MPPNLGALPPTTRTKTMVPQQNGASLRHKNYVARLHSKDMLRCCFKIAATDNTIPLPSASGQLTMSLFLVNSVFLAPPQVGTISQEASHILIDMRARTQLVTRKRMACALAEANRNAPLEK